MKVILPHANARLGVVEKEGSRQGESHVATCFWGNGWFGWFSDLEDEQLEKEITKKQTFLSCLRRS
jgi:hypothetical protein